VIAGQTAFRRRIRRSVARFGLDLTGLTVYTEAATGSFACSALACAVAGARRVVAVARDSRHGTVRQVERLIRGHAKALGVTGRIRIVRQRRRGDLDASDIVTNLGWVRPIDRRVVGCLKPTAVVPLMYEAWELRPGEVDVEACARRGIAVLGTDEGRGGADVFELCGKLGLLLLRDAGVGRGAAPVAVVGADRFGETALDALKRAGRNAFLLRDLASRLCRARLAGCRAVVLADWSETVWIGSDGQIGWRALAELAPRLTLVQLCGVARCGEPHGSVRCVPDAELRPRRMSHTLARLGPGPVIDLIVAGLRVGEITARARLAGATPEQAVRRAVASGLGQALPAWLRYRRTRHAAHRG
jgi:hypothetical protein